MGRALPKISLAGAVYASYVLVPAPIRKEASESLVRFEVEPTGGDHQNGLVALGGTWSARSADR